MNIEKRCSKCGEIKALLSFSKDSRSKDGLRSYCRACVSEMTKKYQQSERGKKKIREYHQTEKCKTIIREYNKKYRSTPEGRAKNKAALKRYLANNREKYLAGQVVKNAVRKGRLVKQPCSACGSPAEAHHEDYSKPLDVTWLCRQHHAELHNERRRLAYAG